MTDRHLTVTTPLGEEAFAISSLSGREHLGRPFEYELSLVSEDETIDANDMLGQPVGVALQLGEEGTRHFHGICVEFGYARGEGRSHIYRVVLRPWFWLLTRRTDCRIFQKQTIPDIIEAVFSDLGFADFDNQLSGTYPEWEYIVQYRESDFNFVSRLMEQAGIYYFFLHEEGKHTLVLADDGGAHATVSGYDTVPYFPPTNENIRERDHLWRWELETALVSGSYRHTDFDFSRPTASLHAGLAAPNAHDRGDYEVFDYPGEYYDVGHGETLAATRLYEVQVPHERMSGDGNARGMACGALFSIENAPRAGLDREYLITSTSYSISAESYASSESSELVVRCRVQAMDSARPYRSPRQTPKPMVQGPQTAIVVGKSGEEIWTDEHARIKVQFHWDRYGQSDENSSCWIRVSQPFADAGFGGTFLPRMGNEVIVEFLEGDPDRPIVTGRVYNGRNRTPYDLPANQTQSGFKTRSTKGGNANTFNEIRFEDKKGSEEMYVQAEKDQNILVKNDQGLTVGHDRTKSTGNDQTEDVGNDEKVTIGNDQTIHVVNCQTQNVDVDQTETIGANQALTVQADRTKDVTGNETTTIGGNLDTTVSGSKSLAVTMTASETVGITKDVEVGAAYSVTVGAAYSVTVGAAYSLSAGATGSLSSGGNFSASAGGAVAVSSAKDSTYSSDKKMNLVAKDNFGIKGDKKGVIEIANELMIKCGSASISMKKNGDIVIKGKKITIKGSGDVVIKGSKIGQN